jgi:hypothetical protein
MSTDNRQNDGLSREQQLPQVQQPESSPLKNGTDQSRRRFTQSGLAVSGVILTLASRPVLAEVCASPSGFQSLNATANPGVSHTGKHQGVCTGRSASFWMDNPGSWPAGYVSGKSQNENEGVSNKRSASSGKTGTLFRDAFRTTSSLYSKYTLLEVLQMKNDPHQLGAHLVSALLNAAAGLTPVLSTEKVITICHEYDQKGFFEPSAGIRWYPIDIVFYLKSTT